MIIICILVRRVMLKNSHGILTWMGIDVVMELRRVFITSKAKAFQFI